MINTIKDFIISFNVYSYYFVKSFWLTDGNHSKEYKIGSSLTVLLIVNFGWIYFINNQIPFNWKAAVFFTGCYHLLIFAFFHKKITGIIERNKSKRFVRYYPFFIVYLTVGIILFFIDIFYY